ncbi:MAG: transposase [Bergeyella sp.]
METETIEFGNYYHIYNRGNNRNVVFFEDDNYSYFLKLFAKYISPVAELYAYCLLRNHFHFLVRIKESDELNISDFEYSTIKEPKSINPSKQFSHFFNAYTQAVNKKYNRTGSLFEKPFERIKITDENYFKRLILYIHNNPLHHGICDDLQSYKWSSYNAILSTSKSKINRNEVLELFEDKDNFIFSHKNYDILNLPY